MFAPGMQKHDRCKYMDIRILEKTDNFMICIKPAGVAVQTRKVGEEDMESILRKKTGLDVYVIHRLDQPVEGITVWALDPSEAAYLSELVSRNGMKKKYLAYVRTDTGTMLPDEGKLTDYLIKNGKTNLSSVVPEKTPGSKLSELEFKVLKRYEGKALVEITLLTGRHHQIRVQFSHAGWPLVGDRKYGGETGKKSNGPLCLCAYSLEFKDKNGKNRKYTVGPTWLVDQ